jgi:hypothetical protein
MKSAKMLAIFVLALGLVVWQAEVGQAAPMGTAITYQGRLMDKNQPAEGSYDFQFKLYDSNDPCTGTQRGSAIDINNVDVIDGHFIVELDFGSGIFDGNAVWLETRVVRSPMGSDPATLSPLLELTPTPYAVYAQTAPAGHSLDAADGAPTDSVYVDDNGNVGIGTTSPGVKLDVTGYINAADYYLLNNNVLVYSPAASGDFYYGWGASVKRHSMSTDGVQRLVIDNSGNVGIGTTSPSTKLEVVGTVNATSFVGDGSGLTGIAGDLDWVISGNDMYSAPSGNVGIGTTNPLSKLSVGGDGIANIGVYGVGSYAGVYGKDSDTGAYGYFGFNTVGVYGGGSDFGVYGGGNDYGVYGYGPGTGVYGLDTISGSYGHIGYDSWGGYFSGDGYFSGNVGVGTTSPSAKLDVDGDINISSAYKIGGSTVLSVTDPNNTFVGVGAGENNTAGAGTYVGYNAGYNNRGNFNTFIGDMAGYSNTTGYSNTFSGYRTGYSNTTGYNNTFSGNRAGHSNTTGGGNTFLGASTGHSNTIGGGNTFVGNGAGNFNTEGFSNTFLGAVAGYFSTTGHYNTFVGCKAGYNNTTGHENIFLGQEAGRSNTIGWSNTFLGHRAGYSSTTGNYNTFVGCDTGWSNTEGSANTFLGISAGSSNTTGFSNTFLGQAAGILNTEGYANTFVGTEAGRRNTTGTGNVFIGYQAGSYETGSNKLYIANGFVDANTLIYGDFSTGNVGIGTTSPGSFRLYVNGAAYSTGGWLGSDRRFKENIETIESPLEKIQSIKGVSFEWKRSEYEEKGFPAGRHFGVIAQEVEEVLPEIVKEGPDGDKAVSYTELVPILTEAIKQQQKQIEDLQQEVAQLKHFVKKAVEWK